MRSYNKNKLEWLPSTVILSSLLIGACETPSITVGNTTIVCKDSTEKVVCDPFNSPEVGQSENKIWGRIFYWDPWWNPKTNNVSTIARSGPGNVVGYMNEGVMLDVELYLNQLNVPTRPFDQGFSTQDAMLLKTPNGNTLYEYFILKMETVLKIGRRETPGYYQFAMLADDGSVMEMDDHGTFRTIVDNDGTHPTRLTCANEAIYFDADTRLPVKINYYQGPRYHIALMLMWRKVADASSASLAEVECGKSGNRYFFNSNVNPPAPSPKYAAMLDRGWKVLSTDNYLLPAAHSGTKACEQSCFADNHQGPLWNTFVLSKQNVDPASIKVHVNGVLISHIYDPNLNSVYVPKFEPGSGDVKIDFCVIPIGNDTGGSSGGGAVGV